jgi:hypothetical protein
MDFVNSIRLSQQKCASSHGWNVAQISLVRKERPGIPTLKRVKACIRLCKSSENATEFVASALELQRKGAGKVPGFTRSLLRRTWCCPKQRHQNPTTAHQAVRQHRRHIPSRKSSRQSSHHFLETGSEYLSKYVTIRFPMIIDSSIFPGKSQGSLGLKEPT